jgi:hypothetical protein
MRFLSYLKYLFIVASITIITLYVLENKYITKYILVVGYILIFSVPILNRYKK